MNFMLPIKMEHMYEEVTFLNVLGHCQNVQTAKIHPS